MKKYILVLLIALPVFSFSQSAEQLINDYSNAMGGLTKFKEVKTVIIKGEFIQAGFTIPFTKTIINNKACRMEMKSNGKTVIQSYKDGKGWTVDSLSGITTPKDMKAEELGSLKEETMIANKLMNYKELKLKAELAEKIKVEGVPGWKIRLIDKDKKDTSTYFLDEENKQMIIIYKNITLYSKPFVESTFLSDYRDIQGMKIPFNRDIKIDDQPAYTIRYTSVEINKPVDEKIFLKPK